MFISKVLSYLQAGPQKIPRKPKDLLNTAKHSKQTDVYQKVLTTFRQQLKTPLITLEQVSRRDKEISQEHSTSVKKTTCLLLHIVSGSINTHRQFLPLSIAASAYTESKHCQALVTLIQNRVKHCNYMLGIRGKKPHLMPLARRTRRVLWAKGQKRMLYSRITPSGTGPGAALPEERTEPTVTAVIRASARAARPAGAYPCPGCESDRPSCRRSSAAPQRAACALYLNARHLTTPPAPPQGGLWMGGNRGRAACASKRAEKLGRGVRVRFPLNVFYTLPKLTDGPRSKTPPFQGLPRAMPHVEMAFQRQQPQLSGETVPAILLMGKSVTYPSGLAENVEFPETSSRSTGGKRSLLVTFILVLSQRAAFLMQYFLLANCHGHQESSHTPVSATCWKRRK